MSVDCVAPVSWVRVVPRRVLAFVSFSSNQLLCLVASLADWIWAERSPACFADDRSVAVDLDTEVEVAVTAAVLRRRLMRGPPSSPLVEE